MRKALGFSRYSETYLNHQEPTEEELKNAAGNLEKYFELITLPSISSNAEYSEVNDLEMLTAIRFFDKKYPVIRKIFRVKIKEFLGATKNQKLDREMIDGLFVNHVLTLSKVNSAIIGLYRKDKENCPKIPPPDKSFRYYGTVKQCVTL